MAMERMARWMPRWSWFVAALAPAPAAAPSRCSRNAPLTLLIAPAEAGPEACPAPASCGQGLKRPPRPAGALHASCLPPQRCVVLELCLAASGRTCLLAQSPLSGQFVHEHLRDNPWRP
jgi:hypothetical protein